jgi:hypothetical protein
MKFQDPHPKPKGTGTRYRFEEEFSAPPGLSIDFFSAGKVGIFRNENNMSLN